jgi:hypothetical protein
MNVVTGAEPKRNPPGLATGSGNCVMPSEHVAHARFCSMKVNAVVAAAIWRILRTVREDEFLRTAAASTLVEILTNFEVMLPLVYVAVGRP